MRADRFVEQRLREARLVALVVAMEPVAVHVDDDVFVERGAEVRGEPDDGCDGFRVLAVDVEDRDREHRAMSVA
jgi:hypothetical protein